MPALVKTALLAVSATVIDPTLPPAPAMAQWQAPPAVTFGETVTAWATRAGQPAPRIDPRIAAYRIGQVSVAADDLCGAVSRLTDALKYAEPRPQVTECGQAGAPLTVAAARR
ncbi:hypothetical protein [Oceanibaculum pacificum]|uniref:hypothetical protein n=1 Tax=Oceanibaculum pacificum TaxID=580166 RepID=UPI0012EE0607|nr:hypothetical protein [Oceanibaculum pacificum]